MRPNRMISQQQPSNGAVTAVKTCAKKNARNHSKKSCPNNIGTGPYVQCGKDSRFAQRARSKARAVCRLKILLLNKIHEAVKIQEAVARQSEGQGASARLVGVELNPGPSHKKSSKKKKSVKIAKSAMKVLKGEHAILQGITGQGAYSLPSKTPGRLAQWGGKSWGKALGNFVGGMANHILPGASEFGGSAGDWLHNKLKDWTGWGKYHRGINQAFNAIHGPSDISTKDLMTGYTPTFRSGVGEHDSEMIHTEFVGPVFSSVAFSQTTYPVNPGINPDNGGLYSWLAQMAPLFEKYWIVQQVYEYRPFVTAYSDSGIAAGLVYMTSISDPARMPLDSELQVDNHDSTFRSTPDKRFYCLCECRPCDNSTQLLDIRDPIVSPSDNADLRLSDHGNLQVSTIGQVAPGTRIGSLYVTFRIRFKYPTLPISGSQALTTPVGFFAGGQTISNCAGGVVVNMFNDINSNGANGLGLFPSQVGSTTAGMITFPARPGSYVILFTYTFSGASYNVFVQLSPGSPSFSGSHPILLGASGVATTGTDSTVFAGNQLTYASAGTIVGQSITSYVRVLPGAVNPSVSFTAPAIGSANATVGYYNWTLYVLPIDYRVTGPISFTPSIGKFKPNQRDLKIAALEEDLCKCKALLANRERSSHPSSSSSDCVIQSRFQSPSHRVCCNRPHDVTESVSLRADAAAPPSSPVDAGLKSTTCTTPAGELGFEKCFDTTGVRDDVALSAPCAASASLPVRRDGDAHERLPTVSPFRRGSAADHR